jgi:dihydrofolate reductase
MRLSLIAAVAENGVIGRDNQLPWRLPRDLRRFKALTMGHHLIVGRKTFESIGRPLPGRSMIVLSRSQQRLPSGIQKASTLEQAVAIAAAAGDEEAFVGGGEQIYRVALPRADRIYLTRVHGSFEGDARFPPIAPEVWIERRREHFPADEDNRWASTFVVLDRSGQPVQ